MRINIEQNAISLFSYVKVCERACVRENTSGQLGDVECKLGANASFCLFCQCKRSN